MCCRELNVQRQRWDRAAEGVPANHTRILRPLREIFRHMGGMLCGFLQAGETAVQRDEGYDPPIGAFQSTTPNPPDDKGLDNDPIPWGAVKALLQ